MKFQGIFEIKVGANRALLDHTYVNGAEITPGKETEDLVLVGGYFLCRFGAGFWFCQVAGLSRFVDWDLEWHHRAASSDSEQIRAQQQESHQVASNYDQYETVKILTTTSPYRSQSQYFYCVSWNSILWAVIFFGRRLKDFVPLNKAAQKDAKKFISNPVNRFLLIRQMSVGLKYARDLFKRQDIKSQSNWLSLDWLVRSS